MRIFARLLRLIIRAKILIALAFMAFANVAFADSGSLHKFFKKNNVSKDMQECIKEQCDEKNFKDNFKDLSDRANL
nr:hypothetical protein [uncultured Helicobacter sp.]